MSVLLIWLESAQGNYKVWANFCQEATGKFLFVNFFVFLNIKTAKLCRINTNMKRFLQKTTYNPIQESNTELCMEDFAKLNIKKCLLETAMNFGVALDLKEQAPDEKKEEKNEKTLDDQVFDLIFSEEGFKPSQYEDPKLGKEAMTIGYGTTIKNPDLPKWARECFGDQCTNFMARVNDPKGVITEPEARKIATHSVMSVYKPRTERLIPNLANFPPDVQAHMISSVYRGSLSGSPKTIALINAGKYDEAATEFLDNDEYDAARLPNSGFPGVATRMEKEAAAIRSLGQVKPQTTTTTTPPASSTTAPTPPPSTSPASTSSSSSTDYQIQKGDTLSAIAKRTGRSVDAIARENKIADPNKISVGQRIRIPKQ